MDKDKKTIEFIKKAKLVHKNDNISYDKVEYKHSKEKACLICKIHGEFYQSPNKHLYGQGCPKCRKNNKLNLDEFVKRANLIHGSSYDYSKSVYVNKTTKIKIICHIHGEFEQTPMHHLRGHGCPICNFSHLERKVMNYLIENEIEYEFQKKFDWLEKMSLDFYLPRLNIAIECQGRQHFGLGLAEVRDNFDSILSNDVKKFNLCKDNMIKIVYVADVKDKNEIIEFYKNKEVYYC